MKHTINDGLRMMGQLLLHHPTTGYYARDSKGEPISAYKAEASCFCFVGAVIAVAHTLKLDSMALSTDARKKVFSDDTISFMEWDSGSDSHRRYWARKLASVSAP